MDSGKRGGDSRRCGTNLVGNRSNGGTSGFWEQLGGMGILKASGQRSRPLGEKPGAVVAVQAGSYALWLGG